MAHVCRKKGRKGRKSTGSGAVASSSVAAAVAVGGSQQHLSTGGGSSWKQLFTRGSKNLKKQGSSSEDLLSGECSELQFTSIILFFGCQIMLTPLMFAVIVD